MADQKDSVSRKAMELMADLQYRNLTNSSKMVAECDLRDVRSRKERLENVVQARGKLGKFLKKQWELGMVPIWIEEAYNVLGDYLHVEIPKMKREENRLVEKIDSLDKEMEEYNEKQEKRKDDNRPS